MKIMNKKISATALSLALLSLPAVSYAAGLIPCDTNCTFNDLIILANNIIKFLMYDVAVPLAALGFMWAGANLVLNQNKEGAWSDAKERFTDMAKGFGIILGAYLVIKLVIYAFLNTGAGFYTFLIQ